MSDLLLALNILELIVSIVRVAEKTLSASVNLELDGQEECSYLLDTQVIVLNALYLRLQGQERVWTQHERIHAKKLESALRGITTDLPVHDDKKAGSSTGEKYIERLEEQIFEKTCCWRLQRSGRERTTFFLYLQKPPGLKLEDQKAWRTAIRRNCELMPWLSKTLLLTVLQSLCPKLREYIKDLIEDVEKLDAELYMESLGLHLDAEGKEAEASTSSFQLDAKVLIETLAGQAHDLVQSDKSATLLLSLCNGSDLFNPGAIQSLEIQLLQIGSQHRQISFHVPQSAVFDASNLIVSLQLHKPSENVTLELESDMRSLFKSVIQQSPEVQHDIRSLTWCERATCAVRLAAGMLLFWSSDWMNNIGTHRIKRVRFESQKFYGPALLQNDSREGHIPKPLHNRRFLLLATALAELALAMPITPEGGRGRRLCFLIETTAPGPSERISRSKLLAIVSDKTSTFYQRAVAYCLLKDETYPMAHQDLNESQWNEFREYVILPLGEYRDVVMKHRSVIPLRAGVPEPFSGGSFDRLPGP